ncbi:MAG: TlpA disulfide reductase family protein [Marinilabiliales bacterium]
MFYACGNNTHNGFTVKGKINGGAGKIIYLDKLTENQVIPFDSTVIDENDEFIIQNSVSNPEYFILKLNDNNFIYLIIDSLDTITVNADAANLLTTYTIEGSSECKLLRELNLHNFKSRLTVDSIRTVYNQYKDSSFIDSVKKELDSIFRVTYSKEKQYIVSLIENNQNSLVPYMALYQTIAPRQYIIDENNPDDLVFYKKVDENMKKHFPESNHTKALHSQLIEINRRFEQMYNQNNQTGINQIAPDIAEPSPDGDTIRLSSLRGKYVLLDFWASWCAPCRRENPNLVKNYNKYHDKGFEIYQVSLDKNKNDWVKAIKDDGLNWIHVSDLQFWNCKAAKMYNVQSIPANFLIDPEGKIIAVNLRGPALGEKLATVLGK